MGCDIHMFAEAYDGSKWNKAGKIFTNPYFDPKRLTQIDSDGYEWNAKLTDEPYRGRNYDLFSILADVRNYNGKEPIDFSRNLPADVSDDILALSNDWGMDGHSHSWFTLEELLEYVANNTDEAMSCSPDFFGHILMALKELGNPEDVRVVFWFDN